MRGRRELDAVSPRVGRRSTRRPQSLATTRLVRSLTSSIALSDIDDRSGATGSVGMPFATPCHREVRAGRSVIKAIPSSRISASQPRADERLVEDGVHGLLVVAGLRSERSIAGQQLGGTTPRAYIAVAVVIGAPSSCSGDAHSGVRMRPCRGRGRGGRGRAANVAYQGIS
jgi:hypothetical protein